MNNGNIFRLGGIVACALFALSLGAAQSKELKIASFTGPKHPVNSKLLAPWIKELNAKKVDGLSLRLYVGGELGKGPAKQFKRAIDRVADITFGLQGYTGKQFRGTTLIELAGISDNAIDGTKRMYAALDLYKKEYDRVKMLAIWMIDRPILMTTKKQVKTIADIKGLKIRTPSRAQAEVVRALGGIPLAMPITKLYNALARGLVDGVLVSPTVLHTFKIKEVVKHFTVGIPFGSSPMMIVMNKKAWDELTPAQKKAIDATTGPKWGEKGGAIYEAESAKGTQFAKTSKKHTYFELPKAEVAKALKLIKEKAEAKLVKEAEKAGVPATKILARMRGAGG